jgi:ATPase subunit of ABC transporter with duplicated ATPase domains
MSFCWLGALWIMAHQLFSSFVVCVAAHVSDREAAFVTHAVALMGGQVVDYQGLQRQWGVEEEKLQQQQQEQEQQQRMQQKEQQRIQRKRRRQRSVQRDTPDSSGELGGGMESRRKFIVICRSV